MTVKRLVGVVVPMPTLPLFKMLTRSRYWGEGLVRIAIRPLTFTNRSVGAVRLLPRIPPLTSKVANGFDVPMPTWPVGLMVIAVVEPLTLNASPLVEAAPITRVDGLAPM